MVLPKIHRLRRRSDFSAVYQSGLRRSTSHLTLRALYRGKNLSSGPQSPFPPVHTTCIGISISQKVHKRAVVRNRIKRQIRAVLRQFLPDLREGWQIVIVVRPGASQCDYQQFLQELRQLLVDAEVINGD